MTVAAAMEAASETTILVIDDDEASRYFKAHVLRSAGFRVCEAARGAEGLEQAQRERPNIVVLDVRLPDMSGLDVCREIKTRDPSILVLQTSAAFTGMHDRAAGLEGGADSYLVEPLDHEELVAVVRALLRMHRAEQELRAVNETLEHRVAERTRELAEANRRLSEEALKREAAEETLRQAEKLDALGQLTGGVAHDFNNLLTIVIGNLDVVERSLAVSPLPTARLLRAIEASRRAALDCERLTQQLLSFARRDTLHPEIVDLNAVIMRFMPLMQRALGERVTIETALLPGLWPCRVDPKQFETALLNLVVNARDAMPLGGPIGIATANFDPTKRDGAVAPELDPGDYVQVCVRDQGGGMTNDVLAHALEPFFTTKDVGEGSGLGLSQVYGFVKQSGGHVDIDSVLGRGTTVNIFLPRAAEQPVRRVEPGAGEGPAGGSETILVVEDNEMVRELAAAMLEELGYRVLVAIDGHSALDIIDRGPDIDLLFTDVVMPNRLSGIELARIARQRRPGIKVLMTSGYSAQQSAAEPDGCEFESIAKPYHLAQLGCRVRQVLDR
jgi:signal transduction histidine kinase